MKSIHFIILFLFVSCGSSKINTNVQSENDAFSEESFMRFGHARLNQVSNKDFLNKSLSECYRGNFKKPLQELQENIKSYKKNNKYWLYIGICYQLYGSQLKANYFYDYALSGSSRVKSSIYNNKALIALKSNNFDSAQALLNKSIKLSPSSRVPKYNLAQVYIKFNHLDRAREIIEPLATKNPNDVDLILSMMTIEIAKGNYSKANSWSKRFKQTDLKREDISLYTALLNYKLKKYIEAKALIGSQRPTIIEDINTATKILTEKIDFELKKIKEEKDRKKIKVKKNGVKRAAVKN